MRSLVLRTAARGLKPLILLFSVYLLLRGHDEPGGGFVAGLVAAAGFSLDAYAYDAHDEERILRIPPRMLIAAGLLTSLVSGIPGLLRGEPFLAAVWGTTTLPVFGTLKLGTPIFFDTGIYVLVAGVALQLVLALMEKEEEEDA